MSNIIPILTPACGGDYKSKAEVTEAFNGNGDFIFNCTLGPLARWDGKLCNKQDLIASGTRTIAIRWNKLRNKALFDVIVPLAPSKTGDDQGQNR